MKNLLLFISILFCSHLLSQTGFNFQGLLTDQDGNPVSEENIAVDVVIDGQFESHSSTTSILGVFNVEIGTQGIDLTEIDWSSAGLTINTTVSYQNDMGSISTVETISPIRPVPLAFQALNGGSGSVNWDQIIAIPPSIADGDDVDDMDSDPANELQSLQLNGTILSLTNGGGQVNLPSGGEADADADPTNEIQELFIEGDELVLSDPSTGNFFEIELEDLVSEDDDSDPENEIQELSLDGNLLVLTNGGGQVVLPTGGNGDADADPTNEIQELFIEGDELVLSDPSTGNFFGIDLGDLVSEDDDSDPENEIQELSLDGNLLVLTNGGGQVVLPTGGNGDADADPTNEIQELFIEGDELVLSDPSTGNFFGIDLGDLVSEDDDSDPENEIQELSLDGNLLVLTNGGGQVVLPTGGNGDADADPTNEIQELNLLGTDLSLSNGGTVSLETFITPWGTETTLGDPFIYYPDYVFVGDVFENDDELKSPLAELDVRGLALITEGARIQNVVIGPDNSDPNASVRVLDLNGQQILGELTATSSNFGVLQLRGSNSSLNAGIGASNENEGAFELYDDSSQPRVSAYVSEGNGFITTSSNFGNSVFTAGPWSLTDNRGGLSINDGTERKVALLAGSFGNGHMTLTGANGNANVLLGIPFNSQPNNGFIGVYDSEGNSTAGIYVDASGDGVLYGTGAKSFVMKHPEKKNTEIWYAAIEGPEAAAYVRGTNELENGKVFVAFPEHFQIVANEETMTIVLTPLSADSKGLAVVEKSNNGFWVSELFAGQGTYSFDWEVKCVRAGFEDFEVERPGAILHNRNDLGEVR